MEEPDLPQVQEELQRVKAEGQQLKDERSQVRTELRDLEHEIHALDSEIYALHHPNCARVAHRPTLSGLEDDASHSYPGDLSPLQLMQQQLKDATAQRDAARAELDSAKEGQASGV